MRPTYSQDNKRNSQSYAQCLQNLSDIWACYMVFIWYKHCPHIWLAPLFSSKWAYKWSWGIIKYVVIHTFWWWDAKVLFNLRGQNIESTSSQTLSQFCPGMVHIFLDPFFVDLTNCFHLVTHYWCGNIVYFCFIMIIQQESSDFLEFASTLFNDIDRTTTRFKSLQIYDIWSAKFTTVCVTKISYILLTIY